MHFRNHKQSAVKPRNTFIVVWVWRNVSTCSEVCAKHRQVNPGNIFRYRLRILKNTKLLKCSKNLKFLVRQKLQIRDCTSESCVTISSFQIARYRNKLNLEQLNMLLAVSAMIHDYFNKHSYSANFRANEKFGKY